MGPSSQARIAIGLLLGLQLLTSLAAVVLLGRTSPAVERILRENVDSTEAVEEMFEVLTSGHEPARFHEALQRAKNNITEAQEAPLVTSIQQHAAAALAGDARARADVAEALRGLGDVNRASMDQANAEAANLGLAGAWAMALLGFTGFLLSLILRRQLESHVLAPVIEVDEVLAAVRAGDEYRRCSAPAEVAPSRVKDNLNWVLDRRLGRAHADGQEGALRAALNALLDARTTSAALLIDAHGRVVAANATALAEGMTGSDLERAAEAWSLTALDHNLRLAERRSSLGPAA